MYHLFMKCLKKCSRIVGQYASFLGLDKHLINLLKDHSLTIFFDVFVALQNTKLVKSASLISIGSCQASDSGMAFSAENKPALCARSCTSPGSSGPS